MSLRPRGRHRRPAPSVQHAHRVLAIAALGSLAALAPATSASADQGGHGNAATQGERPEHVQGASPSDPDGTANGGADKPGGTGGVDTTDQDGNNGSGNDSDCEDDNRGRGVPGHCKRRDDEGGTSAAATSAERDDRRTQHRHRVDAACHQLGQRADTAVAAATAPSPLAAAGDSAATAMTATTATGALGVARATATTDSATVDAAPVAVLGVAHSRAAETAARPVDAAGQPRGAAIGAPSVLPRTGSPGVAGLVGAGLVAVAVGGLATTVTRRRQHTQDEPKR